MSTFFTRKNPINRYRSSVIALVLTAGLALPLTGTSTRPAAAQAQQPASQSAQSQSAPSQPAATPQPTPDPLALTERERAQSAAHAHESDQCQAELTATLQRALTIASTDTTGYEALGRQLQAAAQRQSRWRDDFTRWLESARRAHNCPGCALNPQTGVFVRQ